MLTEVADGPVNWRDMTVRQHLEIALQEIDNKEFVGAAGGDPLSIAAARLLLALQAREHERERREVDRVPHLRVGPRLIARYGAG